MNGGKETEKDASNQGVFGQKTENLVKQEEEDIMENTGMMRPPQPLSFDGNLKEKWALWKQKFELYMSAAGWDTKPGERQVAIFLNLIGDDGLEKFNTFEMSVEDKKSIEKVLAEFEKFCSPKANETVDRHIFFTRIQKSGESFSDYLTELKVLSATCGFGQLRDSLIKDRIVCGINDPEVRNRLLRENDLDLEKCVNMCRTVELAAQQMKTINDENNVHVIRKYQDKFEKGSNKQKAGDERESASATASRNSTKSGAAERKQHSACRKCGSKHEPKRCPAYGKECRKCKKRNHFAKHCRTKADPSINYVSDNQSETLFIGEVNHESFSSNSWIETVMINKNHKIKIKLDTGAQCNAISKQVVNRLSINKKYFEECSVKLSAYGGLRLNVLGKCKLSCKFISRPESVFEFYIVDGSENNIPTVLGSPSIERLKLISRVYKIDVKRASTSVEIVKEYHDVFQGFGCIKDVIYDIKLKDDVKPSAAVCRKLPISIRDEVKKELDMMEKEGIITKVTEPTEWAHPIVVTKRKNGKIRICMDPTELNKYIKRHHYKIPDYEDMSTRLGNCKFFSTLDADRAFHQVKLSEKSSYYLVIITPFGRYRYLRMPFGICSATEVFQQSFEHIFGDIEGVEIYVDDLRIAAETQIKHNLCLKQVLEKAREYNIKFNLEKCNINCKEVKFFGHYFSEKGIRIDDDKIKSIISMKTPKNKKELETFLGMLTYVSRFIPNLAIKNEVLRNLLKKDSLWHWDGNTEKVFNELKETLCKAPVLRYFDINLPVTLSVDASKYGLGAVLLQNNLPIAYASKALTETEIKYAQIEKEALAIAFGCIKFDQYIFGKRVTIESDHKPLENIFRKPIFDCPARLQSIRLKLQRYDIDVKYKPGKELLLADALSRSFRSDETLNLEEEINAQVCLLEETFPISLEKKEVYQSETERDEEMCLLKKMIIDGWPKSKKEVPNCIKQYFNFSDELVIINGLIFKNNRLVVPKNLRKEMLDLIHYTHLGIEKCKARAREILFWPQMSKEIEDLISNCDACLKYKKTQSKETLINREVPDGPWQVLGIDIFFFRGSNYLLTIDYFSKYVEVIILRDLSSESVISSLKSQFSRFGIPFIVYSDPGTQLISKSLQNFSREWNFELRNSSPKHSQSNGMVERHIATVKNIFKKVEVDQKKDPSLALLEYRNTPISKDLKSPNEIMFGRKIRGVIPNNRNVELEKEYENIKNKLIARQDVQKNYYDRNAHDLKPLNVNDRVYVKKEARQPLVPARITRICDRPRSYKLELKNKNCIERNRKHIVGPLRPHENSNQNENCMAADSEHNVSTNDYENNTHSSYDNNQVQHNVDDPFKNDNVVTTTRSGRNVNKPKYLNDYVTE